MSSLAPEQYLWAEVIAQAFSDAGLKIRGKGKEKKESRKGSGASERKVARKEATNWFLDGGEDFQLVCVLAGLEPESVQRIARAKLRAKGVRL